MPDVLQIMNDAPDLDDDAMNLLPDYVNWVNDSWSEEEAYAFRGNEVNPDNHDDIEPYEILMLGKNHNDANVKLNIINTTLEHCMKKINVVHASVLVGGKFMVLREYTCPSFGHDTFELLSPRAAQDWFKSTVAFEAKIYPQKGFQVERVNLMAKWLSWEGRREYPNGIVMAPNAEPEGAYNLFSSFSVEPVKGTWEKFQTLILYALCNGDKKLFNWILDWMASAIQHPEIRYGVALVLRGDKGIGKGIFAKWFGKLFGKHYFHVTQDRHLTGNFNAHQAQALLMFADELIWGGYKSSEGVLKALITEDSIMLERKGIDAVRIKNHIRLLVASNEDWSVPAGPGERRWLVCDCSNKYKEDHDFFAALEDEMNNGGLESMMYELLHRKITTNQRAAPKTAALSDVAVKGFNPIEKWIFMALEKPEYEFGYSTEPNGWGDSIRSDLLFKSFNDFSYRFNARDRISKDVFMRKLKKLLYLPKPSRPLNENGKRIPVYQLPNIEQARKNFSKAVGLEFDWVD